MGSGSDDAWRKWAVSDPYYAVLTCDKYRQSTVSQHRADFFQTGEAHVQWLIDVQGLDHNDTSEMSVLDHGCGVGRLTIPFARHFHLVTGIDVAPGMLEETAKNCKAFGIQNVKLILSEKANDIPSAEFSLVHSLYVLQHMRRRAGLAAIATLARSVRPNGYLVLHITTRRNFSFADEIKYQLRNSLPGVPSARLLRRDAGSSMLATTYNLPEVMDILTLNGCEDYRILTADNGPISSVIISCRRLTGQPRQQCPTFPPPASDTPH